VKFTGNLNNEKIPQPPLHGQLLISIISFKGYNDGIYTHDSPLKDLWKQIENSLK
jgi:hypothetical protein